MVQVVNPFNRAEEDLVSSANLCNCKCNTQKDNNSTGIWTSRLTFNIACGCACNDQIKDNRESNDTLDKNR